ncbi:hypothetical protein GQ55_4G341200 [Panicum hallii var. hallii]|uniref:Uncharacterized protein n=1 Tax=Panicum hallii var. hallii TaxID=1504633 RepID=A0A2T7E328_9POAL|nr:hypothetical protein GQ55_4G341200 [Panicum hallii var. hallii]
MRHVMSNKRILLMNNCLRHCVVALDPFVGSSQVELEGLAEHPSLKNVFVATYLFLLKKKVQITPLKYC